MVHVQTPLNCNSMKLSAVNKMQFCFFSQRISFTYFSYPTAASSTMWDSCDKSWCFILFLMELGRIKYKTIHIIYAVCLKKDSFLQTKKIFFYVHLLTHLFNEHILSDIKCFFFFPTVQQGGQVILRCIHYNYIFPPTLCSVAT